MSSSSLSTRLTATFIAITALCFAVVGFLLYDALASRLIAQDDTNIVLAARHLRRLVAEVKSDADVIQHRDRLVAIVLGDPAIALRISDAGGHVLIDYNPSGIPLEPMAATEANERITQQNVQVWRDLNHAPIDGVATQASLADGSHVVITVARSLADRASLLSRLRRDIAVIVLAGMLLVALLSFLLVRRALRPLRTMAAQAKVITAHRLDARMSLEQAPIELQQLTSSLNDMLERLEQGFARVWQFTVDLAHDLRTPLSNLRGTNEVALTRPRSVAEYESLLGSNIEECERVSRTIESVLFLARAENPQFALNLVEMDLAEQLGAMADYFEGPSSEAGISIDVSAKGSVFADRELFRRAVNNLLANAIRYTPQGKTIFLRGLAHADEVVVSVENPGKGIDDEQLERIFERFFRGDRSRSDSANSAGLGLAIVKSIMDLHGGSVTVQSQVAGLTRFDLRFPRTPGFDAQPPPID
ncbi:two-component sensor histidine kinase [Dyella lipolytica]|uniref:Sensor protein n=1 Tax=Dyella lipolytica TaxID=1867835 RepID=A0ABW8IXF7_9GAMM|nr:heavy metal sensor histidine kinase [Dyella lipolytica]GLQ46014.1 two-component sensor histidine kinase [Dyella lipolytica]